MRSRDPRYELIKPLVEKGKLVALSEIFNWVPKSVVAEDFRAPKRVVMLAGRPLKFTLEELHKLAKFCHLTDAEILKLAEAEMKNLK